MDKTFFDDLCREEAQLVEKLRILREFKDSFFTHRDIKPVTASLIPKIGVSASQQTIFPVVQKKEYKERATLTIPKMILNSLSAIGTGSTQDIAKKLVKLYPNVPFKKALKDTKHHVSLLTKNDEIKVIERRPGRLGFTYQSKDLYDML